MGQLTVHNVAQKLVLGAIVLLAVLLLAPARAYAHDDSQYTVNVDTGYLALRTAPAYDDSNIIGQLNNGDVVTVEEKTSGDFWWVYSPKLDKSGYVNKNNLISAYSFGDYTVKVDKGYLALRTAPSYDDNNIVGELHNGDVVTVETKRGGRYWWVYSPQLNREGYVDADYLVAV